MMPSTSAAYTTGAVEPEGASGDCAGIGVFAVYAAPVVLSGQATFPGYIKLDDDSTFLANLDRAMQHKIASDGA